MANVLSTCYPPVMTATFADAIVNTESAKVYFSLSSFNSGSDIYRVHITVVNQQTNESVLSNSTGILVQEDLTTMRDDGDEEGLYHVTIDVSDLATDTMETIGAWNTNMYYAVQIRFDTKRFDNTGSQTSVYNDAYFLNNTQYFSEWSEVCLVRAIPQPTLYMNPWYSNSDDSTYPARQDFINGITTISGRLTFEGQDTDYHSYLSSYELLQSYKVEVIDKLESDEDEVLFESSRIYTTKNIDQNTITYNLDLMNANLEDSTEFRVRIIYTTKNQYTDYMDFPCQLGEYIEDTDFSPTVTVTLDDDNGIASVGIVNTRAVTGTLYVKRSSSLSNFKTWETIREESVIGTINLTIEDTTVGSGIWYQYYVQFKKKKGGTMSEITKSKVIFPSFYNAIVSRDGKQFGIKYNYTISSMKPVVNRQKIDTLGGQYPKFAENAILNYKQFSVSGLISTQEDEEELFLGKKEFYGNRYNDYTSFEKNEYRDAYTIENYNYFWEREFREKLVEWLNDGEPKLYRSMTEGTMVVMVTDVSLTPNSTLSRRLWNFSATFYEIADGHSLETLDSLGIYTVITPETVIEDSDGGNNKPDSDLPTFSIPGQLYNYKWVSNGTNLVSTILSNLNTRYKGARQNKVGILPKITAVKLHFTSEPKLFYQYGDSFLLVEEVKEDGAVKYLKTSSTGRLPDSTKMFGDEESSGYTGLMRGYRFTASEADIQNPDDGSLFFVNASGYYQIPSFISLQSLFLKDEGTEVTVEYVVTYEEDDTGYTADGSQTAGSVISTSIEKRIVGQEYGYFAADTYIADDINMKYSQLSPQTDTANKYVYRMDWWRGLCVDADPYSVISIKYRNDEKYNSYTVGFGGVLHLLRDVPIEDLGFLGRETRLLDEDVENAAFCEDYECIDSGITATSTRSIKNPVVHLVYHVGKKDYLYYIDGKFYERNATTGIAKVPVWGLVSYYANVYKDVYERTNSTTTT